MFTDWGGVLVLRSCLGFSVIMIFNDMFSDWGCLLALSWSWWFSTIILSDDMFRDWGWGLALKWGLWLVPSLSHDMFGDWGRGLPLTQWGWVTHICVSKLATIGSDNGLSPGLRKAIIWTNAGILLIGPLGTNFSEIVIEIQTFSLKKMHSKISSAKGRSFFLGLIMLRLSLWFTTIIIFDDMFIRDWGWLLALRST